MTDAFERIGRILWFYFYFNEIVTDVFERIGKILWFYFYFKEIMTDALLSSRELEEFKEIVIDALLSSRELEEFYDSISTLKKLWLTLYRLRENWKNFMIIFLF